MSWWRYIGGIVTPAVSNTITATVAVPKEALTEQAFFIMTRSHFCKIAHL
jgi:hypothetical protein